MTIPRQKVETLPMNTDLAEFYMVIGTLSRNITSMAGSEDPAALRKAIQEISDAACQIHNMECPEGHIYDHVANACVPYKLGGES